MATDLSNKVNDLDNSTVISRGGKAVQAATGAQHTSYTGEEGEITYDTTDDRLVAHDGATAGGVPVAKESEITTNATAAAAALAAAAPVGARTTFGVGLATVASAGAAVKLVMTGTKKGDSNGFTVGTDNTLTATYAGTKLIHVKARFKIDPATGTDSLSLHVFVGGASAWESTARSITAATQKYMEIDVLLDVANGEAIEIYAENIDTTENINSASANERGDTAPSHGFIQVTG